MIKLSLDANADYKIEANQQEMMKYPKQFDLSYEATPLPILQDPYTEQSRLYGISLNGSEYPQEVQTKKNGKLSECFPNNASQLSLKLEN